MYMDIDEESHSYEYIISLDLGTTFSGSCFSYIQDRKSIVHVVRWPEQLENDTYEKTPTACLYDKRSHNLIAWGKSALDYMTANPEDDTVIFIDQFKLKLQQIFQQERNTVESTMSESEAALYRNAAIDYLREIRNYTCDQLIKTVSIDAAVENKIRYILTIPATWIDQDCLSMKLIAIKAGLITENDPDDKLMIINEAYAAALFCEREYCVSENIEKSKLIKGQRYLLCDAGGGTVDLATYECTGSDNIFSKNEHCQLALESGGTCGSTILDQNMENYLRDQIFIGCIEESVLKGLVDQFIKEIKHYFGGDSNRNNYVTPSINKKPSTGNNHLDTTLATAKITQMNDIQENDYNYKDDYPDHNPIISFDIDEDEDDNCDDFIFEEKKNENEDFDDCMFEDEDFDDYMFKDEYEDEGHDDSMFDEEESSDSNLEETMVLPTDYVYFTLPIGGKGIDQSILENLSLRESIVSANSNRFQLRISHTDISKYVFDPVIEKVISLIGQQIKKSHTKIDTLFLLGGFGQSPYLHKRLHHEFITTTKMIPHIIVPENGYRASMRGGIYFGIDYTDTKLMFDNPEREILSSGSCCNSEYNTLVGIDFNFFDLTAVYSFIDLENPSSRAKLLNKSMNGKSLYSKRGMFENFSFDTRRFVREYYPQLYETLFDYLQVIRQQNIAMPADINLFDEKIFYGYIIKSFIHQLYESIEDKGIQIYGWYGWKILNIRYCFSTTLSSLSKHTDIYDSKHKNIQTLYSSLYLHLIDSPSDVFPVESAIILRKYVIDLINIKASSQKSEDMILLKNTIFEAATEIGMVKAEDRKDRILSNGFIFQSCLVYQYYSSSLSSNKEIFTFDLFNETGNECRVITCNNKETMLFSHRKYSFVFDDLTSIHTYLGDDSYGIKNNHYTLETLVKYLATRTNIMVSHVSDYIKHNVDFTRPINTHKFRDIFFFPGTERVIDIKFGSLAEDKIEKIYKAIHSFKNSFLTTELILSLIIIPWIKYHLALAVINICRDHQGSYWGTKDCVLLFDGEIIKTNTKKFVNCPLTSLNDSWEYYLFTILRDSLENYFKKNFNNTLQCSVMYDRKPEYSRHFDCLFKGIIYHSRYISRNTLSKSYALHIIALNLKATFSKPSFWYKTGNIYDDFTDEEELKINRVKAQRINALDNDGLTYLHPLLDMVRSNLLTEEECLLKIQVPQECSIALVLYASEDKENQEYSISNNSFKKLHRFIFPIQDPKKSIIINCKGEKQSLLFTVKHDNYEADFRCPEFLPLLNSL